jgi:hypothetical protein
LILKITLIASGSALYTVSLRNNAYASNESGIARASDEGLMRSTHPELKDACGAHPMIKSIPIKKGPKSLHDEVVTYCPDKCKPTCTYEVFIYDAKLKKYGKVAEFKGDYNVLSVPHNGFLDIQTEGTKTLQFDGTKYAPAR